MGSRGALMFISEPCYLDIAQSELADWPLEDHQRVRPVGCIMIKMSVRRNRDINRNFGKIREKPFSPEAGGLVSPRIDKDC